jgi:hypothetical protein
VRTFQTTEHDPDPEEFVDDEEPLHLHDHPEGGLFGHIHDGGWDYHQHTLHHDEDKETWVTEGNEAMSDNVTDLERGIREGVLDDGKQRVKEKESELQSLVDKNARKHARLAREGLRLDGTALAVERMELLVEGILGRSEQRLDFEIAWQQRMSSILAEAENDVPKAKLDPRRGGLIRP